MNSFHIMIPISHRKHDIVVLLLLLVFCFETVLLGFWNCSWTPVLKQHPFLGLLSHKESRHMPPYPANVIINRFKYTENWKLVSYPDTIIKPMSFCLLAFSPYKLLKGRLVTIATSSPLQHWHYLSANILLIYVFTFRNNHICSWARHSIIVLWGWLPKRLIWP